MSDLRDKIDWDAVRVGDVLMHENGDRLTVQGFERIQIRTTAGLYAPSEYRGSGFTPHREVEPVPTEPGAYHDKDGATWLLDEDSDWFSSDSFLAWGDGDSMAEDMAARAPFTRLVPMPSSDAVMEAVQRADPMCRRERITDAVMALLRGGGDE